MDRRSFISTVAGALLAAPIGAEAQPAEKVYRVGFLAAGTFCSDAAFAWIDPRGTGE